MAGAPAWATESPPPPDWAKGTTPSVAPDWAKTTSPAQPAQPEDSTLRKVGRNVAAAADIALGAPAWVAKMGQTGITDVVAAVSGDPHPMKSAREATEQDWSKENFLQAPAETLFGVDPNKTFMGSFGNWAGEHINSAGDYAAKKTGNPEYGEAVKQAANIVMAKAGDILIGTKRGITAAADHISAAERLKTAQPTGTAPPPDWSIVPAVEKRMDTQPLGEPSDVVHTGRVEEMRKRSAGMQPNEPIAHPDEGNLDEVLPMGQETIEQYANRAGSEIGGVSHLRGIVSELQRDYINQGRDVGRAKLEYLAEHAPESSGFSIEVATPGFIDELDAELAKRAASFKPPYKPSPEAAQEIHEALTAPELSEGTAIFDAIVQGMRRQAGERRIDPNRKLEGLTEDRRVAAKMRAKELAAKVEVARDIAAEKVAAVVKNDHAKQSGKISPRLLAGGAAVAGGAAAGAYIDKQDPLMGALYGAGLGFAISNVGAKLHEMGAGDSLKAAIDVLKPSVDPMRKMAADAMAAKEANIAAGMRSAEGVAHAMSKAIKLVRRERIGILMSSGTLDTLTPKELAYVDRVKLELARIGSAGQEAGALPNLMKEYGLPLMWDMKDAGTKSFFDELMRSGAGEQMNASDFTPFSLKRSVPDYMAGMAAGLKPLTTDPAALLRIYARSVLKATENARALSYLKAMKTPEGYAVMPVDKFMPSEYVSNHGIKGLEGFGIHPEMVDSLKLGFDGYEPGMVGRGLLAAAFTAKRLIVSYSPFHAVSEALAYTGAGGNPVGLAAGAVARGIEKLSGDRISIPYRSAVDKAFDAYYRGGAKDSLDFLLRNGLKKGAAIEDTVGRDTFKNTIAKWADTAVGMDKLQPFTRFDDANQAFTFGYVQTGVKLATAMRLFEKELIDPKNAGKDINQIAADVASFSNGMAGGLNFPRIIEGMKSKFGRALAGDILSKKGLTKLQIAMLAPDWFYSTLRAWTQAVPGLSENARVGRLQRAYLARSLVYTLIAADAANVHYSGHHLWENDFRTANQKKVSEEPNLLQRIHFMTQIDMGDGTRVNPNKHLYEFVHMVTDFPSFVMNKANPIVGEPAAALMNKQWLSPHWTPPITPGGTFTEQAGDYAKWALKQNMPISLQQLNSGANYGIVGFPRSGISDEKRQQLQEQAREVKQERGQE